MSALASTFLLAALAVPSVLAQDDTVVISSTLEPATLEIAPGTTVTWRNDDSERHRIRSREGPETFDSGNLEPGETFTHTFALEGTYPYLDERDDENAAYFGTIMVTSSPTGPGETGELATSGAVTIGDRVFIPPTIEVATGSTVAWTNADGDSHTATSSDGAFDSGILAPGASYSTTFDQAGSYPYFCEIHPDMQGTVTVSDPVAAGSPAAAGPSSPPAESPSPAVPASPAASSIASPSPSASPSGSPAGSSISASPSASPSGSPMPVSPSRPSPAAAPSVFMAGRAFDPPSVEVPAGGSVGWTNDDQEGHTVTAADGSFDSGIITPGGAFSQTFDTPGLYDYFCAIHPEMQGSVIVSDDPASASGGGSRTASPTSG